jgi:hypothetical protein
MPTTAEAIETTVYAGINSIHAKLDEYCDNIDADERGQEAGRGYGGGTPLVAPENADLVAEIRKVAPNVTTPWRKRTRLLPLCFRDRPYMRRT